MDPLERHDVSEVMRREEGHVSRDQAVALPHETCRAVAARMVALGLEQLPVVGDRRSFQLIGSVSRSDLLEATLVVHEEETLPSRATPI